MDTVPRMVGVPQLRRLRRRICGDVEGNRALSGAVGGHSASRAMSFIAIC